MGGYSGVLTWLRWLLVETLDSDEQFWVYWEPSQVDKMLGKRLKQVKSHRPGRGGGLGSKAWWPRALARSGPHSVPPGASRGWPGPEPICKAGKGVKNEHRTKDIPTTRELAMSLTFQQKPDLLTRQLED